MPSKIELVGADDMEIARQFARALEEAARTGDRAGVYPLLADDVEWVTPKRTLRGLEALEKEMIWGSPPEKLDLEFEVSDWADRGEGRIVADVHQVYRWKGTGEIAYERERHIELTIRDGKVSRYEMRIVG
jgi:ketosteroid isomerase-like protein